MLFLKIDELIKKNLLLSTIKLRKGLKKSFGLKKGSLVFYKKKKTKFRKKYIFIDFWRNLNNFGYLLAFKYDPNRSALLCLIFYATGYACYSISVDKLILGQRIFSGFNYQLAKSNLDFLYKNKFAAVPNIHLFSIGNTLPLYMIPLGFRVSLIEIWTHFGAQLCRSAGLFAVLLKKDLKTATLKLKSGWKITVNNSCLATIGTVSNAKHMYKNLKKAGTSRNLGRRTTVRGVAMNAVDHPHGGGRGKSSIGKKPMSPWGKLTKWAKTVKHLI